MKKSYHSSELPMSPAPSSFRQLRRNATSSCCPAVTAAVPPAAVLPVDAMPPASLVARP
jgi:hypothetical protein